MQPNCSRAPLKAQTPAAHLVEPARRQVQRLARMQIHDPGSLPPLSQWLDVGTGYETGPGW